MLKLARVLVLGILLCLLLLTGGLWWFAHGDCTALPQRLYPQWSGQKRPMVVGSKPANGCSPERGSFILVSPGQASPFLFSSFVARISECDRGVAVGRAWR
jgi:hypothetical protein